MPQISKGLVASGVLAVAAGGVLLWQVDRHLIGPKGVVSAETARGWGAPGVGGPSRRGASRAEGGEWTQESGEEDAEASMRRDLNSATPGHEKMRFAPFTGQSVHDAFNRIASIGTALPEDWRKLQDAWQLFMEPVVANDAAKFIDVVGALGGYAQAAGRVHEMMVGYLGDAAIGWDEARVRRANVDGGPSMPGAPRIEGLELSDRGVSPGIVPIMAAVSKSEGPNGESLTTRSINLPLSGVFPETVDQREVYEVWVPARLSSSTTDTADCGVSVFMARVNGQWQPAAVRLGLRSERANELFSKTIQINRQQPSGGDGVLRTRGARFDDQFQRGGGL